MNESIFSREIRKSLDQYGYFKKMVGGMYIVPGIPDILGCYKGRFMGIECKQIRRMPQRETANVWHNLFSDDQVINLETIKRSGGIALGLIHIAANPREQFAIALVPDQIRHLNRIDLRSYTGLIDTNRFFVIHREKNGFWNVEYLLDNLDRF